MPRHPPLSVSLELKLALTTARVYATTCGVDAYLWCDPEGHTFRVADISKKRWLAKLGYRLCYSIGPNGAVVAAKAAPPVQEVLDA